jgi:cytochrome oxidase assembly protein ShyY1
MHTTRSDASPTRPSYRFLLAPRWIAFHLGMAGLVVLMVNLGFWQLRRLDEKQTIRDAVDARAAAEPQPVTDWLSAGGGDEQVDAAEWRSVLATGEWDDDATTIIVNRSSNGMPGYNVVTPLRLGDGTGVLVNRGFIPLVAEAGQEPTAPAAPDGTLTVLGRVRADQTRGVPAARISVERLQPAIAYPLLPAYLELEATTPPLGADQPVPVPAPEADLGPHLSYALQWFFFSACVVAGWVLAVRRSARTRAGVRSRREPPLDAPPQPDAAVNP